MCIRKRLGALCVVGYCAVPSVMRSLEPGRGAEEDAPDAAGVFCVFVTGSRIHTHEASTPILFEQRSCRSTQKMANCPNAAVL